MRLTIKEINKTFFSIIMFFAVIGLEQLLDTTKKLIVIYFNESLIQFLTEGYLPLVVSLFIINFTVSLLLGYKWTTLRSLKLLLLSFVEPIIIGGIISFSNTITIGGIVLVSLTGAYISFLVWHQRNRRRTICNF